jgi:hypothetical protein
MFRGTITGLQKPATVRRFLDPDQLVSGDTLSAHHAGDVNYQMSLGIILIDRKGPGVAVFPVIEDDLFPDVGGAD